ncbi:MAG TPA: SET domain-containing protein-lysine N-methyltransferase [Candidatus Nitrosocosmicus sp.]|nr:SET domain-containing protein-lysine N-methyltransferase [Candidatus Nitrosocosmicus sp.]
MFLIPNDYWEIRKTKEKGNGVFALKKIISGTVIGDYIGKVIKIVDYQPKDDREELYLMYFTDEAFIYPDLNKPGIHLLNHSCNPNCWMYMYQGHTLFFAIKDIEVGEELTISYLLSPDETCNPCPHICKCGSNNCRGTWHISKEKYERWERFQKEERSKTKMSKYDFNKNLPKLSSYPKRIPIHPIYKAIMY